MRCIKEVAIKRLFNMILCTLLLFLLQIHFVFNVDDNDPKKYLLAPSQDKRYVILHLNKVLPSWTYYWLDRRKSSSLKNLKLSNYNEIFISQRNLNCNQTECLTLVISSVKYFTELVEDHLLRNGPILGGKTTFILSKYYATLVKRVYELYMDLYLHKASINLEFLFQGNYQQVILCHNVSRELLFFSKENKLIFMPGLFIHTNGNPIDCNILTKPVNITNNGVFNLKIYFSNSFLTRNRRSSDIHFEKDQYAIDVKENIDVGETILKLKVYEGSGNFLFKKNTDLKSDRLFKVDENSGEIKILSGLDREEGATLFALDITASDKDNINLIAYTTVVINVIDINDNYPIFSLPIYSKTIKEEQPLNQFILTVQASDRDIGINSEIEYSFTKNIDINFPFQIDQKTGVIKNVQILDREFKPSYVFDVKAEDKGVDPGPLSAIVSVNITLEDINDNKPIFLKSKFVISLPEDTPINQVVLNVTATDADSGSNGKIEYRRLSQAEFSIDSSSGEIKLTELLDFDRSSRIFEFTVDAFDCGFPPQHASVLVEV